MKSIGEILESRGVTVKRLLRIKDEVVVDWSVEPKPDGFVRLQLSHGGMRFGLDIAADGARELARSLIKSADEATGGGADGDQGDVRE